MKRETVSAPVVEEPIRTALRERFSGDCFFWDPKDPDGVTLLRTADRARRAGRAFAASMNEADVRELPAFQMRHRPCRTILGGEGLHYIHPAL